MSKLREPDMSSVQASHGMAPGFAGGGAGFPSVERAAFVAAMSSRKQHMVDNARAMAKSLGDKGVTVTFDLFPEEDHFSVLASQLGRAVPFALRK